MQKVLTEKGQQGQTAGATEVVTVRCSLVNLNACLHERKLQESELGKSLAAGFAEIPEENTLDFFSVSRFGYGQCNS